MITEKSSNEATKTASCQTAVSSRFLPQDVTLKDLRLIRNYFGEHDKTMFEHRAYALLDSLIKHFEKGDPIIEQNGVDWNIWQNLKSFEEKEQSIWKTQKKQ